MVVIRELATDDEDSDFSPGGQGPRPETLRPRVRRRTKSSGDSRKTYPTGRRAAAAARPATGRAKLWFIAAGQGRTGVRCFT